MAQVKKRLAEEDLRREQAGTNITSGMVTLSGLVVEALELEEIQCVSIIVTVPIVLTPL
jgi:hypothetical protein